MSEFKSVWSYHSFAHRIIRRSRYIRDSETDEFLLTLRESARDREEARLAKDSGFWRAQMGNDWKEILDEDGRCIDHEPGTREGTLLKIDTYLFQVTNL
jgi:hypothetical protein